MLAALGMRWAGVPPSAGWAVAGWTLTALGAAGFTWAVLAQLRGGTSPNPYSATRSLVTTGPYRWSRNPIYLCDLLLQAGVTLLLTSPLGLALVLPAFLGLRRVVVRFEEPLLHAGFPDIFPDYCRRTRRWL